MSAEALAVHNLYRERHLAWPLEWDKTLAAEAQVWADTCVAQHEANIAEGENLAIGPSVTSAINQWYNEVYRYDFSRPGFSSLTGHFTQLVWGSTRLLGCAQARCPVGIHAWGILWTNPDMVYLVCRYSPRGNTGGYSFQVYPAQERFKQVEEKEEDSRRRLTAMMLSIPDNVVSPPKAQVVDNHTLTYWSEEDNAFIRVPWLPPINNDPGQV